MNQGVKCICQKCKLLINLDRYIPRGQECHSYTRYLSHRNAVVWFHCTLSTRTIMCRTVKPVTFNFWMLQRQEASILYIWWCTVFVCMYSTVCKVLWCFFSKHDNSPFKGNINFPTLVCTWPSVLLSEVWYCHWWRSKVIWSTLAAIPVPFFLRISAALVWFIILIGPF